MKKKKVIYLLIIIMLSICSLLSYKFYFQKNSKNKVEKPIVKPTIRPVPKPKTEEELKLEKLGNIHESITFFKKEYLDKYLEYKEKHPELSNEKIVVYVNIGLYRPFFKDAVPSLNKHETTVIANKYYFLGSDYIPKDLVTISSRCSGGYQRLTREAATNFEKMCNDAIKAGYHIRVRSAYRSFNNQRAIYSNYVKRDGERSADRYSARAGYSEHQTGLAADISNNSGSFIQFGKTKEFKWMQQNSYKYGFILRYTKENEPITGYMSEPWHYRYVGVDIATYMHNNPMTYEEYFVRFLENKQNQ